MRIGVIGAGGRMGSEVCRAVAATDGLELVAAIDPHHAGRTVADVAGVDSTLEVAADLDVLVAAEAEVAVALSANVPSTTKPMWLTDE